MFAGDREPVPYAPAGWSVHQRLAQPPAVTLSHGGGAPLPVSGSRQVALPLHVRPLPRIWRMMSSASLAVPSAAALTWPLVHAEVRFCVNVAKLDVSPNSESR